jgi:DNA-binding GntR family transcriptional regulator
MVRATLRSAILRGDLPGDARLVQTEIASQLGVSTTPVREAMRDLASDGLITLDSHRIGTVRKPDWAEMLEIVEIRRNLERYAISLSMERIADQEMDRARQLAEELSEEEDLGSWVQKNGEFHSIFHRATGTSRLAGILVSLESAGGMFTAQAQRLHPDIRQRAVRDHFALLDAYESKDLDAAFAVQYEHISLPLHGSEGGGLNDSRSDSPDPGEPLP